VSPIGKRWQKSLNHLSTADLPPTSFIPYFPALFFLTFSCVNFTIFGVYNIGESPVYLSLMENDAFSSKTWSILNILPKVK